ncbi:hypothetical protein G6F27_000563 [Rhizopus arrhizus]|nr:hypothetical protein G6F27_000563 [Rhizopus arrhizus]
MLKSLKSRLFGKSVEDEASTRLLGDRSLDQWKQEPIDKYNLIYFVYGVAMLLPWNVFITASEFFAKRFAGTIYEERFQNYFSTYSTLTNLLTFILVLWLQSKSLFKMNSFIPIVINTIVFGTMAITVEIDFQGEDYFCGQGIAGVVVAVSSILSALAGSSDSAPDDTSIARSAFLYFLSALLITLTALVGRVLVTQLPFYNYHIHSGYEDNESGEQDGVENEPVTVIDVVRKSYGLIFSVAYVFVITLILFPSLTALIKSVHRSNNSGRFFDDDIFVAFHFLLFNVGDWVGRVMPLSERFQVFRVKSLVSMSLLRTIFVPLFLVCNVVVSSERNLPVLVRNDFVYFLIVWIFAVSNGWIGSLCMMAAPQQKAIKSGKEKSMVGSVMSFSLVLGLAIGGLLSFPFRQLI